MLGTQKRYTPPKAKGQNGIEESLSGLAYTLALIAAFLMSGPIHEHTAPFAYQYLLGSYGSDDMAFLGMLIWDCLATAAIFFLSRALILLAFIFIATRLFVAFL
jgi:hypothetical protein